MTTKSIEQNTTLNMNQFQAREAAVPTPTRPPNTPTSTLTFPAITLKTLWRGKRQSNSYTCMNETVRNIVFQICVFLRVPDLPRVFREERAGNRPIGAREKSLERRLEDQSGGWNKWKHVRKCAFVCIFCIVHGSMESFPDRCTS